MAPSKESLKNMEREFDYKMTQASLALANGDQATTSILHKELVELELEIENHNKWMMEVKKPATHSGITKDSETTDLDLVQDALHEGDVDTADKILNQIEEVEEQWSTGVNYGCTDSDPSPFKDPHAAPWWLGREGYEELTSHWLELDAQGRTEIGKVEADVVRNIKNAGRSGVAAKEPCSCGAFCWVRDVAEKWNKLYPEDSITKDELEAQDKADTFEMVHQQFTCKIRRILKEHTERVSKGADFDDRVKKCLCEISALAKGKKRDDELYVVDSTVELAADGPVEELVESLKIYCGWISRNQLEVDTQILYMARIMIEIAEQLENEKVQRQLINVVSNDGMMLHGIFGAKQGYCHACNHRGVCVHCEKSGWI